MTATNRLIIWNKDVKRGFECADLWEHTEWPDKKLPGKRRACKSWWSRKWRSRCRRFAPRRGCSPTPNHKVSLAGRPAWSPARPLLWHTYYSTRRNIHEWEEKQFFHCYLSPDRFKWHAPKEHEDGLRKGLKVVVAIDLRSVDHGYFPKNLKTQIKLTNFLLSHKSEWHWMQQGFWMRFE